MTSAAAQKGIEISKKASKPKEVDFYIRKGIKLNMIYIILSLGAINAFIPLIIILILVVAAAGLMRGYNIFALFGIPALLFSGARGSMIKKSASGQTKGIRAKSKTGGQLIKAGAMAKMTINKNLKNSKSFVKVYSNELANVEKTMGLKGTKAALVALGYANSVTKLNYVKNTKNQLGELSENIDKIEKNTTLANNQKMKNVFDLHVDDIKDGIAAVTASSKKIEDLLNSRYNNKVDHIKLNKEISEEYMEYKKNVKRIIKNTDMLRSELQKEIISNFVEDVRYNTHPTWGIKMAVEHHNIKKEINENGLMAFPTYSKNYMSDIDKKTLTKDINNLNKVVKNIKMTLNKGATVSK
ncbi:MAG: hypothetical protein ACP5RT_01885 [Candidatus Micrarchaeia archaeon]